MATATTLELDEVELPVIELDDSYEVVDGKILEEPHLGVYETRLASRLIKAINLFDPLGDLGEVVTETLFVLSKSPMLRRRPDLAFISQQRWPTDVSIDRDAAWDVIPDLAVEFTSPTDLIDGLMDKIEDYFAAGVRLVWVIYPKQRKLYAYKSPKSVTILGYGDELDGGDVLPGYRISLTDLFELRRGGPPPTA